MLIPLITVGGGCLTMLCGTFKLYEDCGETFRNGCFLAAGGVLLTVFFCI